MVTQQKILIDNEMEKRLDDILIMYAAGIMSRMDKDYIKSVGWTHRAERAAFQMGAEFCQRDQSVSFGVSRLDKSYIHGRAQAQQTYKIFNLDGDEIHPDTLPKSA